MGQLNISISKSDITKDKAELLMKKIKDSLLADKASIRGDYRESLLEGNITEVKE